MLYIEYTKEKKKYFIKNEFEFEINQKSKFGVSLVCGNKPKVVILIFLKKLTKKKILKKSKKNTNFILDFCTSCLVLVHQKFVFNWFKLDLEIKL